MPTTPKIWNNAATVHAQTAGTQRDVQTVQLANGDYWVMWNDNSNDNGSTQVGYDIVGQRFNALGEAQGGPVEINSLIGDMDEVFSAAAGIPGSNDFVVAYQHGLINGSLIVEHKGADGSSTGYKILTGAIGNTSVANMDIAAASATNGIMLFERTNGNGDTDIRAIRFNPTTLEPIGNEIEITSQTDDSRAPMVTVLANGTYAVVYQDEYNGSTTDIDIKGAIVNQDGTVAPFSIAASTAFQVAPSVTALAGGNFVVSWQEGATGDVKAAIFNPVGQMQGTAFTVATGANDQNDAQVAGLPDGGFAIAWEDDTTGSVMLRSYNAAGTPQGVAIEAVQGLSTYPLSLTAMADGRVILSWDNGNVQSQIWDPRSGVNTDAVYGPDEMQIGTANNDVFEASSDADIVHGWDGDDTISDGNGTQKMISGDAGNDVIKVYGFDTAEAVDGGTGIDTLSFQTLGNDVQVYLKEGFVYTNSLYQQTTNFEHFDALADITSQMTVFGTDGVNFIGTGAGADNLDGGQGADYLAGRAGNDTYYVDHADDTIYEYADEGFDMVSASTDYVLGAGVHVEEMMVGDMGATVSRNLTGNEFGNGLWGNAGINILTGAGGNDSLMALDGDDQLDGGEGHDWLNGGAGKDQMTGGTGDDGYVVDRANDLIVEADGEGYDSVFAETSYTLGANVSVEYLRAYQQDGTDALKLVGNGFDNLVEGNAGANILNGGGGADILAGFGGNDRYIVDNEGDTVLEAAGGGIDKVESSVDFELGNHIEKLILTGSQAIDGTGNELDNIIVGNNGGNILDGGMGADILEGKDGNDRYVIDNVGDKILETATGGAIDIADAWISFSLAGQYVETLRLMGSDDINGTGNNQVNTIFGNEGDNVIKAAGGDDKLYGGDGNDTLTGGTGADRFIFDTALGDTNVDKIVDFSAADDAFYLDKDVFAAINNGALNASAFVVGSEAKDANDRIIYDKANGDLFYDADGSGAGAAFHFASVADNTILTSADFIGF